MQDFKSLWSQIRFPIFALIGVFVVGTIGYGLLFPDEPIHRLVFMTAITLSTVGYNDMFGVETNQAATWFTLVLIFLGMGLVLYSVSALTASFVEGHWGAVLLHQRHRRMIKRMENHYIICGAGRTGKEVVREMYQTKRAFVVLEWDEAVVQQLRHEFPGILVLPGDAASDDLLVKAGIERARGLVATLSSDKDNLFLAVTAQMLNHKIRIASKMVDPSLENKLRKAGAEYAVSPAYIGGMRIASSILRPNVVGFLDKMLRDGDTSMRLEEVALPEGSPLAGKTLAEAQIGRRIGVNIIAYGPPGGKNSFIYNPTGDLVLQPGGVLLFIGDAAALKKLTNFITGN